MHDLEIKEGRIINTFTRHISYNYTLTYLDNVVTFLIKLLYIFIEREVC